MILSKEILKAMRADSEALIKGVRKETLGTYNSMDIRDLLDTINYLKKKIKPSRISLLVKSYTGKMRYIEVRKAENSDDLYYALSDSGNEYAVQFLNNLWMCECKHWFMRCARHGYTCHHIDAVRQSGLEDA